MIRFHHLRQEPVRGLNQMFRLYRPMGGGIGMIVLRHEISIRWEATR